MKGLVKRTAAIGIGGLVASVAIALPASADFRAYDYANYISLLVSSPGAVTIDVPDNRTASVKNQTAVRYSAKDTTTWFTTIEVFNVGPWMNVYSFGSANDKIDFFQRK